MSSPARRWFASLGPIAGLALAWVLFAVLAGAQFTSLLNQRLLLEHTVVVGIAAVGATWIIASGGIDLSVGSTIALGTMVVAFLLERGCSPMLAAACAILASVAIGASIGLFVSGALLRFALSPFVVTLGMWGALRGLAKGIGGSEAIHVHDIGPLGSLMHRGSSWMPAGVWIWLALALVAALALQRTVFGRHAVAIGSNEETARLCGVRVARTKLLVYAFGVGCAGIASVCQFSFLMMGDPTTAQGYELKVIAAVVIGGASLSGGEGSIAGTLIGALIMTVVDNGCTQLGLDNWVQEVVTGAIIVAAVALDRWR